MQPLAEVSLDEVFLAKVFLTMSRLVWLGLVRFGFDFGFSLCLNFKTYFNSLPLMVRLKETKTK
jgi:hypothetical protein